MDELSRRPTSHATERALFHGYSRAIPVPIRTEPCLCGGTIEAVDDPEAIADAVRLHNESTRHEQWAIATGWR